MMVVVVEGWWWQDGTDVPSGQVKERIGMKGAFLPQTLHLFNI